MDSAYFNSWLRQAQQFGPLPAGNREVPGEIVQSLSTASPLLPIAPPSLSSPPQGPSNEPLDLRVKPVDSPLDLTVNKPSTNCLPASEISNSGLLTASFPLLRSASHPSTNMSPHHPSSALFNPYINPVFSNHLPKYIPPPSDRKLHCNYCAYQCDMHMREGFDRHLASHAPYTQHYCIYCKRVFTDQTALNDHLLMHDLVYAHVCTACNLAFKLSLTYTAHMAETHNSSHATTMAAHTIPRVTPENMLLKVCNVPHSPSDQIRSASTSLPADLCSSPLSNTGGSNSCSSLLSACSSSRTTSRQSTFGHLLAKQIEEAISQRVACGESPSLPELMFMKSESSSESAAKSSTKKANSLNLMSLMDKVVEEGIRAPVEKPNLHFMVTFSDDEEETEVKESTNKTSQINGADCENTSNSATVAASPCDNAGADPHPTNPNCSQARMDSAAKD